MADIIGEIINLILVLLVPIITGNWFGRVQKNLVFKKWMIIAFLLVMGTIATIGSRLERLPQIIFTVIYQGAIIIVALLSSRDKLKHKVSNLFFFYLLMIIVDLFTYTVSILAPTLNSEVLNILLAVLLAPALYLAEKFIKNAREKVFNKKAARLLLIPIAQTITIMSFGYIFVIIFPRRSEFLDQSKLLSGLPAIFLIGAVILSLIADILAFNQYMKNLDLMRVEAENESLEYQNQLNLNYFNELRENEAELRKIKHDINGCLEAMKEIVYTEKDLNQAQRFFDELSQKLGNISTGFYSKNSLINAIIISKAKVCSKQGIKLNIEIDIPEELNISDMDICRILTNIFDNAIEANMKLAEGKFIDLSIKENDQFIYLSARNPYNGESVEGTTKSDKKEHGFGMKILKDFAEKYSGYFKSTTEADTNTFLAMLVLKNAAESV